MRGRSQNKQINGEKNNLKETKIMQGEENFKIIIISILRGIRGNILTKNRVLLNKRSTERKSSWKLNCDSRNETFKGKLRGIQFREKL